MTEQLKEEYARNAAEMRLNHSHNEELQKVEKKIARNDTCPCGSGKKYKQCCGKSGPKKGIFAS